MQPDADHPRGPARPGDGAATETFTAVFRGTREQGRTLGMLFGDASPYGELIHISLGNVVADFEALQKSMKEAAHDDDAE